MKPGLAVNGQLNPGETISRGRNELLLCALMGRASTRNEDQCMETEFFDDFLSGAQVAHVDGVEGAPENSELRLG